MSITSSNSDLVSFESHSSDSSFYASSTTNHSFNSLPALFALPEMAPPKARREGKAPIGPAQQRVHTTYQTNVKQFDIAVSIERSVCSPPLSYRAAIESERCNSLISEHTAFYTPVLERGIGLPLRPFFKDILDFYNFAPAQLSPLPWCHRLGTLLLYRK